MKIARYAIAAASLALAGFCGTGCSQDKSPSAPASGTAVVVTPPPSSAANPTVPAAPPSTSSAAQPAATPKEPAKVALSTPHTSPAVLAGAAKPISHTAANNKATAASSSSSHLDPQLAGIWVGTLPDGETTMATFNADGTHTQQFRSPTEEFVIHTKYSTKNGQLSEVLQNATEHGKPEVPKVKMQVYRYSISRNTLTLDQLVGENHIVLKRP